MRGSGDHVLLIGGGITSALAAVRLSERGLRVTVVEKAAIGNGSSSRSNACIRAQFGVEETVVGLMYSEWWYEHFHSALHTPAEGAQPVYEQNGYLFLYEDPTQAADGAMARVAWEQALARLAMQQRVGLGVEALTPAEVQARWPHLEAERLIGATWCPRDGFLYPHVIYGEGFRRARELGATVLTEREVLGARTSGGRITAVETTAGPLAADWVVNATNAWAPRVSARLGGMPLPIAPLKRYLYLLRMHHQVLSAEDWRRLPMTIYGMGPGRGAFTRPDGPQLVLGYSHEAAPEPDFRDEDQDRIDPGFSHEHGIENFGYSVMERAYEFAPSLFDAGGLAATTCGYYGMTPDGSPLIGWDAQVPNLLHAAGFSGHGVMHAPITAVLVEALLAGEAQAGQVRLPAPFQSHAINLATFAPARDFAATAHEAVVL